MKAHLAKVSLALLSAVFLLGCQERGSGPVGPEGLGVQANKTEEDHTHGKGGGDKDNPEGPNVDVTLTDGITSGIISDDGNTFFDRAQPATLTSDGGRVHAFNAGVGFFATLALNCTAITGEANNTGGLVDYLNFAIGQREQLNEAGEIAIGFQFFVQRKKGSGSFQVSWRYPDDKETDAGKGIRVKVSSANVESFDHADQPDVTTFTFNFESSDGGTVEVRRSPSTDGGPGNDKLTCSYVGSDLVILLDRSPS